MISFILEFEFRGSKENMPISGNSASGLDPDTIMEASRQASQQRHTFNASERATYVKTMINRVEEYRRQRKSVDEIKELLPEFVRDYKHLFEMITSPEGYNQQDLNIMLNMLMHMHNGNLTQHDASVIVGKRLYEKYGSSKK
jgi:hypothetical protein